MLADRHLHRELRRGPTPHDPQLLCLFRTISHYVTNQPNSQNAGALGAAD
jgi:hypothetical protein